MLGRGGRSNGYSTTRLTPRRTFLSWLHFAVVLGGLAVGLLNFGDKVSYPLRWICDIANDQVGKISAAMYTVIGMSRLSPHSMKMKLIRSNGGDDLCAGNLPAESKGDQVKNGRAI